MFFRIFLILSFVIGLEPLFPLDVSQDIGAVALVNARTGRILYARSADESFYPASTTKIATALYILDVLNPPMSQKIRVSKEAVRILPDSEKARGGYRHYPSYIQEARGTSARFQAGDEVTVEDAFYGLMLASGNDAANVLAESFGGTIDGFVVRLNEYLRSIGCTHTNFTNPHGLHHPDHVTTAFDLARMAQKAIKNQNFRTIVATSEYTLPAAPGRPSRIFRQGNLLIRPGPLHSPYAVGVKTGHLSRAKHCLVAAYEKGDRAIIGVFLKCNDRKNMFKEMKRLFEEFAREELVEKTYVKPGLLQMTYAIPDADKQIGCYAAQAATLQFYPSEEPKVTALVTWSDAKLPIRKGDQIGVLNFVEESTTLASIPLLADQDVELPFSLRLKRMLTKEIVIVSGLFFLTACWLIGVRKKHR